MEFFGAKIDKEWIRIFSFWLCIFVLVVFTFQLGNWNANNVNLQVKNYCDEYGLNHSIGFFGDVGIWKETKKINISSEYLNITTP